MKTLVFSISGMHCDHCVHAVDGALRALQGVTSCRVSLGEAVVTIDDAVVSRAELVGAVRKAGAFDVTGFSESALA
jgi:copper chaperone CopZ